MMNWCLMSSDVSWHIRDKLWPMPKHGFNKSLRPRKPEGSLGRTAMTATSTLTQLLNYVWTWGRGRLYSCGPNAQVLTTSYVRAIQFSPNQTREKKKERLKGQGLGKHTMHSVTLTSRQTYWFASGRHVTSNFVRLGKEGGGMSEYPSLISHTVSVDVKHHAYLLAGWVNGKINGTAEFTAFRLRSSWS